MRVLISSLLMKQPESNGSGGRVSEPLEVAPAIPAVFEFYGEPIFSFPNSQVVRQSNWGNREKSATICEVAVPVLPHGLMVKTAIYARLDEKTDGDRIVPEVGKPTAKTLGFMDPDARDRFMAHVEKAVDGWTGYDKAYESAVKLLTRKAVVTDAKGAPIQASGRMQPRLVAKPA